MIRLGMEWAALPMPKTMRGHRGMVSAGQSYYAGDGRNKAHISVSKMRDTFSKMSKGGKVELSRGGKLTLGPSKMGNGYENIRDFFESQQANAANSTNAFSKISSDIGKLNSSVVNTDQIKSPPKINIPELTKKESIKVPPAPKNVNISAAAPSSTDNVDKLSTIAATMEEDDNSRMSIIPIPTAINNSSASLASPRPKVVRARTPITYGF
jgi:hypothetical protein